MPAPGQPTSPASISPPSERSSRCIAHTGPTRGSEIFGGRLLGFSSSTHRSHQKPLHVLIGSASTIYEGGAVARTGSGGATRIQSARLAYPHGRRRSKYETTASAPLLGEQAVHRTYMQTAPKYYEIILSRVSSERFFIKACSSLMPKISNLLSTGIIESASSGAAAHLPRSR